MSHARPVVALTGLEGRDNPYPGVAIARCLREARGDDVVIVGFAYDPTLTGCFRNDLFDRVYLTPFPGDPPAVYLRRLREIHSAFPLDVIVPALDSELPLFARYRSLLAQEGIRMVIPPETSVKARTKQQLYGFCRGHAIFAARTEVITDPTRFFDQEDWNFPCYLKGALADAVLVDSRAEAIATYQLLAQRWGYPVLAQEPVPGDEYDICVVADRSSQPVASVAIRKTIINPSGKAAGGVVVEDREALDYAHHVIRCLEWEGPLELELVREWGSGRFTLIEVNARFPAWIALPAFAGVNMPDLLLRLALVEPIPEARRARPGTMFIRTSKTTLSRVEQLGTLAASGVVVHRRSDHAIPARKDQ